MRLPIIAAALSLGITSAALAGGYCPPSGLDEHQMRCNPSPPTNVPEPMTLGLLGIGLAGTWVARKLMAR